jgi:hypothetical protein
LTSGETSRESYARISIRRSRRWFGSCTRCRHGRRHRIWRRVGRHHRRDLGFVELIDVWFDVDGIDLDWVDRYGEPGADVDADDIHTIHHATHVDRIHIRDTDRHLHGDGGRARRRGERANQHFDLNTVGQRVADTDHTHR